MFWIDLVVVYLITHLFGLLYVATFGLIHHPGDIYENSKVNWFGAIFIYLLWFVLLPIYGVFGLVIWLCTTGRD